MRIRCPRLPLTVVLAVAVLGACGDSPLQPGSIATIQASTSFGFCVGYCRTTLTISSQEVVFLEEGTRSTVSPRRRTAPISTSEWESLVSAIDRSRIEGLPAIVGCPDCADAGAESLEVLGDGWRKRVDFDYGAAMPELQPLLARVRAVRQRLIAGA